MSYLLSATRLLTFTTCPRAYQFRYELKLPGRPLRTPQLGLALHRALQQFYRWPGAAAEGPSRAFLQTCWAGASARLEAPEQQRGAEILERYFQRHVSPLQGWRQPLAVEGRLKAPLAVEGERGIVELTIIGRCDRLEYLEPESSATGQTARLHLIEYKTGQLHRSPDTLKLDLQLGLYQIAIRHRYQASLAKVSHVYLAADEVLSYAVAPAQESASRAHALELVEQLLEAKDWACKSGPHCRTCAYRSYCPAWQDPPTALPTQALIGVKSLQLSLPLSSATIN
ncbi:PD-(D/E)XK nuclease family protein [Leptolyngbya sp. FACHB-261]|uniref:RecB family exonuclease n=1 Tax=Leptolyngbya sp. FACHB-261 TaxID=2692806 RepID=UPI001682F436|nr:PD-(D/E)XK nuclease family protein [Leptolyngbya sp. FACHB-261]MBD2104272.1 PD-(D/E)XK nuclease family protein [Leptolyngbya sp. FACHB-261]